MLSKDSKSITINFSYNTKEYKKTRNHMVLKLPFITFLTSIGLSTNYKLIAKMFTENKPIRCDSFLIASRYI
nr:hypothetical protein CFP56_17697 [Quercus suber]